MIQQPCTAPAPRHTSQQHPFVLPHTLHIQCHDCIGQLLFHVAVPSHCRQAGQTLYRPGTHIKRSASLSLHCLDCRNRYVDLGCLGDGQPRWYAVGVSGTHSTDTLGIWNMVGWSFAPIGILAATMPEAATACSCSPSFCPAAGDDPLFACNDLLIVLEDPMLPPAHCLLMPSHTCWHASGLCSQHPVS